MTETAAATAVPWLVARGLSKQYGAIQAAQGMDLDISAGEVHGLIGPNGAGKSTLVKMLSGVVRPDAGQIFVDGAEVSLHTPVAAQAVGIVLMPQEVSVIPDHDLVDNVTLGTEATRFGIRWKSRCLQRTTDALSAVGLTASPGTLAGELSAAEQRMLMLARAIDRKVRLLILDEPTAGMPPREARRVVETVHRLASQGIAVLYISHDLTQVADVGQRVTCVRGGRILATLEQGEIRHETLVSMFVATGATSVATDGAAGAASVQERGRAPKSVAVADVSGERLEGVTAEFAPNEVTGITGLLGSGVSELVSIVVGSARAASGTVLVDGEAVSLRSPGDALRREIAFVSGDRARVALTGLSIKDNVSISALDRWFGRVGLIRRRTEQRQVTDCLDRLSIKADIALPLSGLSGGNQQRALVARLLAADADVLVFEEPTVGVDVAARQDIWDIIRSLASGRTIVVASSESEELVATCDRVVCLRGGKVSAVLTGKDVNELAIARAIA